MSDDRAKPKFRIMIVAGESSGDAHAAALVNALRTKHPEIELSFFGATGPAMRSAGVETVVETDHLAILGLYEIARALGRFWRAIRKLKRAASDERPDAVILVDWPDFNLRLARALHGQGRRVIYYISPQLWAWRSHRIRGIRRDVDLLLTILPFEQEWYRRRGVEHVEYVGHPLAGEVKPRFDRAEFCRGNDLDPEKPIVALLPGSRHKELVRILPVLVQTAAAMQRSDPNLQFVIPLAPSRERTEVETVMERASERFHFSLAVFHVVEEQTREALAAADVAVVASGTATLEAAIIGTPMVVVYKESKLNFKLLRWMIKVDHFGLVNLIGDERIAAELIQHDLTEDNLEGEVRRLLDPRNNRAFRERLAEVNRTLGEENASHRAAEIIAGAIKEWRASASEPVTRAT